MRLPGLLAILALAGCPDDDDEPAGPITPATSGFDVKKDGLSFENFQGFVRSAVFDVPAARRLFGDNICSRTPVPDCVLTPEGLEWSAQVNGATRGGLCEGFAALSHLTWKGDIDRSKFGTGELFNVDRTSVRDVDREIAYWFGTQYLDAVVSATRRMSAGDLASLLSTELAKGKMGETYRLGIVRMANGAPAGGHALTPYAIEPRVTTSSRSRSTTATTRATTARSRSTPPPTRGATSRRRTRPSPKACTAGAPATRTRSMSRRTAAGSASTNARSASLAAPSVVTSRTTVR